MSSFFFKFRCDPKYESTIKQMYDISMMVPSVSNLDTISLIAKSLNYPHLFYPKIHVGGTNGKGSVIKKISSILTKSGYKIGTYSSPHISSFRERIKINNKPIPKKNVVSIFNLIKKHMNLCNLPLPYFELLTMMAFEYFKEEEVDCAVIEVGMGGDLDATNIIDPLLSIITSIGLDHTNVLGNSLEEISKHKAGIIKPNIPVILGNDIPTIDVFTNKAKEMNSPIYYSTHNYKSETYDEENNETVKLAIDVLRKSYPNKFNMISEESIEYGLSQRPSCRMEKVFDHLPKLKRKYKNKISDIYLDVGHNFHGLSKTIKYLKSLNKENRQIKIICAFSKGKDYEKVLNLFSTQNNFKVHFLSGIKHNRLIPYNEIVNSVKNYSPNIFADLNKENKNNGDLLKILDTCNNNEVVLICGTFFIMKNIRQMLGYREPIDSLELNEKVMPKFINEYKKL